MLQISQEPVFVPGVWGPYYSAMVPGLWVNEGGQSVTGKLVRVESNGNELLSWPADCYVGFCTLKAVGWDIRDSIHCSRCC